MSDQIRNPNLNFTEWAKKAFVKTVKDPYFRNNDYDLIFDLLKSEMRIVPFGDYLKRYIYEKKEMQGDYRDIPLSTYQDIICSEFCDRHTPCSFVPTSVRLRNAVKNWLEQQTVNRNVVLLLGFGLGMSLNEVNTFLTKALQEYELNAKDPFEAICWYCYRFHFDYNQFTDIWDRYQNMSDDSLGNTFDGNRTIIVKNELTAIYSEKDLLHFLSTLPVIHNGKRQSITARSYFDKLYCESKELVAHILTDVGMDTAQRKAMRTEELLSRNDNLYDFQKIQKIKAEKGNYISYSEKDISAADIESILLSAVPKDKNGNLVSLKESSLEKQFLGKRLSRQRITDIISGTVPITRYDLLTLFFFIYSQTNSEKAIERYKDFIHEANQMLHECSFGSIYVTNPYECFLLLCLLTDDPLGTYADVWEMSYQ